MTGFLIAAVIAAACIVSPEENPAPGVIGPMTGHDPAWLIDGSSGRWAGANQVVKTLWIFSRKASGSLRVTGRRLDGDGTLRFQDGGVDGHPTELLEIADPWRRMGWPGNASAEVRGAYAFVPNYIIYPSRGCWRLEVVLGRAKTQITLEMK